MKALSLLLMTLLVPTRVYSQTPASSRVYVQLYPCNTDGDGNSVKYQGPPVVTLYDQQRYGDYQDHGFAPPITVTRTNGTDSDFYFDVQPGNYDAFLKFPDSSLFSVHNGPLIVIRGYNRNLFIAGCSLTDWHRVGAVAGRMPLDGVTVSVLFSESRMQCGDDIYALNQKTLELAIPYQRAQAVIDDGAYYANFHGYGKQDHTVALEFTGALFTRGAVLITETPSTPAHKPPFILKDITPEIVQAATRASGKLACVPGF